MIRRQWFRSAAAVALGAVGATRTGSLFATPTPTTPIFVLRNEGCMCCQPWADHLTRHGFQVHMHDSRDLDAVKDRLGVPDDLQSCHTGMVEGYLVEGHVPARLIRRMLDERTEMRGLAVPGMPVGAPGREGENPEPFDVVAFGTPGSGRYVVETVRPD